MKLHNLQSTPGSRDQKVKRVGRGHGSGMGKTSTRGSNGQKSRKSGHVRLGFEGGQTPLYRRSPKIGFNNVNFANNYQVVSLKMINDKKLDGVITLDVLKSSGLISNTSHDKVKIIGNSPIAKSITIKAHKFTTGATKVITDCGAKFEVI